MTEEVYKNWVKRSSRSKKDFIVLKQKNDVDKINNFPVNSFWCTDDLCEAPKENFHEMEEWKRFHGFSFDTIATRRLNENYP